MSGIRAAILTIGDELLAGDVIDTNKAFLARNGRDAGLEIVGAYTLRDRADEIVTVLRECLQKADLCLVCGGLGPTEDDLTSAAIARAVGVPLERRAEAEADLRAWFERIGRPLWKTNLKQADLPRGSVMLPNGAGTAPGFAVAYSRESGPGENEEHPGGAAWIVAMPGVPHEMQRMFREQLLPRLGSWFALSPRQSPRRVYRTMGLGESELAQKLGDAFSPSAWETWIESYPNHEGEVLPCPRIHYRAHAPEVLLILEFEGVNTVDPEWIDRLDLRTRALIGPALYAIDERELVDQLADALCERGLRVAVAESCTGGGLGEIITRRPGSSSYFEGGVIAYSNALKTALLGVSELLLVEHGAVSAAAAGAMARGARDRLAVDLAIAVTGIAGPGGALANKPRGTVFVGVATSTGEHVLHLQIRGDRAGVRRRAAQWAFRLAADCVLERETWLGRAGEFVNRSIVSATATKEHGAR